MCVRDSLGIEILHQKKFGIQGAMEREGWVREDGAREGIGDGRGKG